MATKSRAKSKKTIAIAELVEHANKIFRESTDDFRDQRRGLQTFVEDILMKTDNYRGFNYLTPSLSKPGNSVGILFDVTSAREHEYPDDSRIFFY